MADNPLGDLPEIFRYTQARHHGLSDRKLYELRDNGIVEVISRGLYRRTDNTEAIDPDLLEIAHRAPEATLCLTTALARHGLTDIIPPAIDIALPRGRWTPTVQPPVLWHHFNPATFTIGRHTLALGEHTHMGLYGPERSIIDAFRLAYAEGPELAITALRRWLRGRGNHPAALLAMAEHFPKARPGLRHALEVLL